MRARISGTRLLTSYTGAEYQLVLARAERRAGRWYWQGHDPRTNRYTRSRVAYDCVEHALVGAAIRFGYSIPQGDA